MLNMAQLASVVNLPVQILKQGKRYIAYTPVLDLSTSGRSIKEAQKRFEQVISIFFEEITEAGTIDEVLSDLGWKKQKQEWHPPQVVSQKSVDFRLPTPVAA